MCHKEWAIKEFLWFELNLLADKEVKIYYINDAASGWAGWALAHLEFGSSVNPIATRAADYAHHITASPPGFENQGASLISKVQIF